MILSMTGYGTGSAQRDDITVTVEIRTVNHRFLDLHIRVPREYLFLESEIQQLVRKLLNRGRVEVSVTIQGACSSEYLVNNDAVRGYMQAAGRLREQFELREALDLKTLLSLPGVLQNRDSDHVSDTTGALSELAGESVNAALAAVLRMRLQEGEALRADMLKNLANVADRVKDIHALSSTTMVEYQRKLEDRLARLLPHDGIDPQRLAQEVALMAEKCDISEEIARLESHLEQYGALTETGKEVGKKLDFLLQEMQRAANTILSKSGDLEITRHGIAIKAEIEKLREQVQNVE